MDERIEIPPRFNGPPGSANGGYCCGCVAALFPDAPSVEVSLRSPPPLGRPLRAEREDGGLRVLDGETLVAEGGPAELSLDTPAPVSPEEAEGASEAGLERWSQGHPFPTCFVCGPEREPGDGLRIFPGALDGEGRFACTLTPGGAEGTVPGEVVWSALDCPTSAPGANWSEGPPVVLARLTARLHAPVHAGRRHVVMSWPLAVDGRKREAGSALYSPDGEVVASARALWIELRTA